MWGNLSAVQRRLLIVVTAINFLNYLDRQVIFALLSFIKVEFRVTDFALGLLGTSFMVVHALSSLPLGALADRWSRRLTMATGVLFWSGATFASGLSRTFGQLVGLRALVGVGEAAYAPAATALISEQVPQRFWSRAQGLFNGGMFIGGTLGAAIGGALAFYLHQWRAPLLIVGIPGLLLSYFAFRLPEGKRPRAVHGLAGASRVVRSPVYRWVVVSGLLSTFAAAAYISWGVEFILRYKDFNLRDTSVILGLTLIVAGTLGVVCGSWIADHVQTRVPWGRSATVAVSLVLAAPAMYLGLHAPGKGPLFIVFFGVGTALLAVYHAPATAVMHDAVPSEFRATAFALYLLVIHLVGSSTAPALVGSFSDHYGLRLALELTTVPVLLSGLAFAAAAYYEHRRGYVREDDGGIISL